MMLNKKLDEVTVISKYDSLVKKQQRIMDDMSNTGREKDYKVQKIEKYYESKIDILTRQLQAVALQIDTVQRYIAAVGDSSNPAVNQIKKSNKKRGE